MLLTFYDKNNTFKGVYEKARELCIEQTLEMSDKNLSFECQLSDISSMAQPEGYIETADDIFVIKEITRDSTNATARVYAQLDLETLEGKAFKRFESVENKIIDALRLAFAGTGWTIGQSGITKKRTLRMENVSALTILKQALKTYRAEIQIDSKNKRIDIYEKIGTDKGVYFISDLNLKKVEVQSTTYDFYTEIEPYGKDGIDIKSVNDGQEYLTNYTYSTKQKRLIWKDERYTVLENLKEDAQAKLDDMAKPYLSYTGDLIDLANMSDAYEILSFEIGDVVWLINDETNVQEQQRIVGIKTYPDEPERSSFTLANKVLTFDEMTAKYEEAADTVNNITSDNGTVSGASIDSILADQISDFERGVANTTVVSGLTADMIETNTLIATEIQAVRGEFGTIVANSGTFEELSAKILEAEKANIRELYVVDMTAAHASIDTLESNYANIVNLLAGNASVGDLSNIHLTSANASIEAALIRNAVMQTVTVNDLLAGEIDTSKFRIISGDGGMVTEGATTQYYDNDGHLRLQIGRDATGDFNYIVYTADGEGQLFNADGITASAIGDGLIVNDMVSDNAGIMGSKLDIASVIRSINGNNSETINMSKIWYDEGNQSLTQLYTQMSSAITNASTDAANAVANSERALQALDGIPTVDALAASLSNESHIIHTDYEGNGGVYTNAKTTVSVFKGDADVSAAATITVTASSGVTGSWNASNRTYSVTNMTVDNGYVDFNITYGNNAPHLMKRFSLSKSYDGKAGYAYDLIANPMIVTKSNTGALTPPSISLSAKCYKGDVTVAYIGIFAIETSNNGTNYTEVYRSASAEASRNYTVPNNVKFIRVTLIDPLTNSTLSVKTVLVLIDAETLQGDVLSLETRTANIETSINGLNVDLADVKTDIYGVANGGLILQITRTDSADGKTATFRQTLYSATGRDVTNDYQPGQFQWYIRDEDHPQEYFKKSGTAMNLSLSSVGYGAHVIGTFTDVYVGVLVMPNNKYITFPDGKALKMSHDSSDYSSAANS